MPLFSDLAAAEAALIERATGGRSPAACGALIADGLDVYWLVVERPPHFGVLLLGLQGDEVRAEIELEIAWGRIDETTRLGILAIWAATILERSRRDLARAAMRQEECRRRPPEPRTEALPQRRRGPRG
jgi:hypothetical protein